MFRSGIQRYLVWMQIVTFVTLFGIIGTVTAQELPGQIDPGRIEKRFEKPPAPKSTFEPVVPKETEAVPPEDLEKIKFVLTGIVVEGSTVYTDSDFLPLYEKYLSTQVSLADVYRIAEAITARYRNDGYVLSRTVVPPQRIQNGMVRITAIEGFIDSISIEGSVKGRKKLLEAYGNKITASQPLKAKDMERYLLLINDLPGVRARSVLTPSEETIGASHLTVVIEHKLADGFASLDNRGSKFSGPLQAGVGLNANSVFKLYEQTGVRFITTPEDIDELIFFSAHHQQQIGTEGTKAYFYGSASWTEPGDTLAQFNVEGNSTTLTAALTHPFIRSRTKSLSADLGFNVHNSESDILNEPNTEDRLRVINLRASYDFVDRFRGVNLASIHIGQGLNILDATKTGTPNMSREGAESDFTKLSGHLFRLQEIYGNWSVLGEAAWQYSFSVLPTSEQFGVGGSYIGRGYDYSEITGDNGVSGKVELQYGRNVGWKFINDFQLYGFFDTGTVWNKEPIEGQEKQQSLSSAGGGVRFNLAKNISGFMEVGKPLTRNVASENSDDARVFFGLVLRF